MPGTGVGHSTAMILCDVRYWRRAFHCYDPMRCPVLTSPTALPGRYRSDGDDRSSRREHDQYKQYQGHAGFALISSCGTPAARRNQLLFQSTLYQEPGYLCLIAACAFRTGGSRFEYLDLSSNLVARDGKARLATAERRVRVAVNT
eukprot:1293799-Rhodomonas_salina.2